MSPEDLYRVGEAARIGRVSVRTLHHYDAIGLLHPSHRGKGRYRFYTRSDLDRLHQIRLYQLFGLSLEEIGRVIDDPDFDARGALRQHRQRLMSEVAESRALIQTIDRLLDGDSVLASEDLFLGFREEFWAVEASERWGEGGAWREAQERANGRDRRSLEKIRAEHQEILRKWSAAMRGATARHRRRRRMLRSARDATWIAGSIHSRERHTLPLVASTSRTLDSRRCTRALRKDWHSTWRSRSRRTATGVGRAASLVTDPRSQGERTGECASSHRRWSGQVSESPGQAT